VSGVSLDEFLVVRDGVVRAEPRAVEDARMTLRWPGRIKHLSASSLGMFRRCPEQFRHRYILGEKERPGESILVGSAFHEALEYNYKQKIESHEDRPLGELIEFLQDAGVPKVLEEAGGAEVVSWDQPSPEDGVNVLRADSERILAAYRKKVTERIQPIAVEQKFSIPMEPVPVIGYIDTGTDDNRVIDTKTGKQAAKKLKPSWMLQGDLYAAATGWDVEYHAISRAARPTIVTGLESEEMIIHPNEIAARNVLSTATQIADMIAYLYTTRGPSEPWPTLGKFADWSMTFSPCTNCGWRKVCPAWAGEA
jgi:PD-(D/E)XK nuclease superfamily